MIWLRACPKCTGDLFLTRDLDGPVVSCLQCGRVLRPDEEQRIRADAPVGSVQGAEQEGRDRRVA